MAQVRVIDHYDHGRIKIWVDNTTHYLAYGHRTGYFVVTPDPHGNDGVSVESARYPKCGTGEVGWYFHVGHSYRIVVTSAHSGSCTENGTRVVVPQFAISKVS